MKYKVWGALVCLAALLTSLAMPVLARTAPHRYHQHLEAPEKEPCTHGDDVFCTHLPLVEIDTGGVEIPGRTVMDENGKRLGYARSADGEDAISARMEIVDHQETNNHVEDAATLSSRIVIHVRGNSSRAFDKAGYHIRLVTETGENNPQSVMGMDAHHEWALHGPFLDKTLLRNYMWYNLAGEVMDYAPNVRFCEVMLNGEYQGVYVMLETITAGRDGARLELSVDKKDSTFGGYLLRLDRGSETELKNIRPFTAYTMRTQMKMNIVYPGTGNLTPELREGITRDFSAFEKALYSYDYNSPRYGLKRLIDMDSFADYFILNELTCNYDAGWLSTYIYKDVDGKFRMCIWDFNSACDNYEDPVLTDHFEMHNCLWYFMLTKDEDFVERVITRYRRLRQGVLSEEALNDYVDGVVDYLGPAIQRNFEKWGYALGPEYDMLAPAVRNPHSHEEAIRQNKEFLVRRGAWMDENIETLRQYCADSRVKKFNENAD